MGIRGKTHSHENSLISINYGILLKFFNGVFETIAVLKMAEWKGFEPRGPESPNEFHVRKSSLVVSGVSTNTVSRIGLRLN